MEIGILRRLSASDIGVKKQEWLQHPRRLGVAFLG